MRIGLVQTCTPATVDTALGHAAALVAEAAAAGATLVMTPEGSNLLQRDRPVFFDTAPHVDDPAALAPWAALAMQHGVTLVVGSLLLRAGDGSRAVNRCVVFGPDGAVLGHYDKIHLFDVNLGDPGAAGAETRESAVYDAGHHAPVLQVGGVKLGITICYDVRFPELYRRLARAGADVIAIPSAFTAVTGEAHWDVLTRARAIETGSWVLAPAQGGLHEDGRKTWGHSRVIDPWGRVVAGLDHDRPGVLVWDVDLHAVSVARRKIPAWSLARDYQVG
ncbi:MAG: carbon-nitrogen hydrolase family protein [Hyphomonadaceae bacterium]|jgi:predicted amidohydrolase|nr:carbon-nitrogen hydrolase family protein [Hyphomonadaceae bacterium]